MRDDLESRVKMLEDTLLEVQIENAKLRDLIVNPKLQVATWTNSGPTGGSLLLPITAVCTSNAA